MTWTLLLLLSAPLRPGVTAMKPVVCRQIDDAKGRQGVELAQAVEAEVARFAKANYALSALLPGDPPIACFRSMAEGSKLPRGAQ
ncbi:MAG TPA: hypothetical protein VI356_22290 [Myxococcales bacterium]